MYTRRFGFRKNPFRQPADSQLLFLGRHHDETIAHLTYAVTQGEGFTVITGESGVGKTTVCRAFLQRLKQNVVTAYLTARIGLEPLRLARSINTAFGVQCETGTIKDLTDALNMFLIRQKRAGKKVALFIDDAQVLSAPALEQVRLLSNLETARHKLLQIVMIGRPTLSDMLASRSLRQIGQRVSVRYHIDPLDAQETVAYVQHRISISSQGPPVRFDQAALRAVHKFSRGIPRHINLACDRILTAAHKCGEKTVTTRRARSVLRDMRLRDRRSWPAAWRRYTLVFAGACVVAVTVIAAALHLTGDPNVDRPGAAPAPAAGEPGPQGASQSPLLATETETAPLLENNDDASDPKPVGAPDDRGQLLATLDSMRRQHNLDQVEAASAVGAEPSRPMTYSVQVGAFLLEANARRRRDELKNKDYRPRIIAVTDPQGRVWYTVRIGDYPSLDSAQEKADEFSARENGASVVRPFNAF